MYSVIIIDCSITATSRYTDAIVGGVVGGLVLIAIAILIIIIMVALLVSKNKGRKGRNDIRCGECVEIVLYYSDKIDSLHNIVILIDPHSNSCF